MEESWTKYKKNPTEGKQDKNAPFHNKNYIWQKVRMKMMIQCIFKKTKQKQKKDIKHHMIQFLLRSRGERRCPTGKQFPLLSNYRPITFDLLICC